MLDKVYWKTYEQLVENLYGLTKMLNDQYQDHPNRQAYKAALLKLHQQYTGDINALYQQYDHLKQLRLNTIEQNASQSLDAIKLVERKPLSRGDFNAFVGRFFNKANKDEVLGVKQDEYLPLRHA